MSFHSSLLRCKTAEKLCPFLTTIFITLMNLWLLFVYSTMEKNVFFNTYSMKILV